MAVKWTGLDQYPEYLGRVPEREFSITSDPSRAIIIEWRGQYGSHDHAAKIITYYEYSGAVYVKEYSSAWNPHVQYNTYYPPYDHPLSADDIVYWWKKDPPPLSVNISGPTELGYGEVGEFTATPTGGAGTYTNYRWWKRNDETRKFVDPMAPPPGEWIELTEWEGEQTIQQTAHHDFSLKCIVYDVWNNTAQDIHSVLYIQ